MFLFVPTSHLNYISSTDNLRAIYISNIPTACLPPKETIMRRPSWERTFQAFMRHQKGNCPSNYWAWSELYESLKYIPKSQMGVVFGDSPVCTANEIKGLFALTTLIWQSELKKNKPKNYKESSHRFLDKRFSFNSEIHHIKTYRPAWQ